MGNESVGKLEVLMDALDFIEAHLTEEIRTEQVAEHCFCSRSGLEKLFRNVNHLSVHDYVIRRRMSLAARRLLKDPEVRVLDLAMEYGYGSHEAFARAFRQVWGVMPSEYRRERRGFELFPRLMVPTEEGQIMGRRQVDITKLYDLFQSRRDCWFVCCDIQYMIQINDISRKAGDAAILESLRRMNDAAGEEDVVFRIGGDEFALLTASPDRAYAEDVKNRILAHNGECVRWEDREIPLSLYGGLVRWADRKLRYNELFSGLHETIQKSKN